MEALRRRLEVTTVSDGYWGEDDADRLAATESKSYLASQLVKNLNEVRRLKGSLSSAYHIIAFLAVVAVFFVIAFFAEPTDLYLWISDDYHARDPGR